MQANDERDQALEDLANGKTTAKARKPKTGGIQRTEGGMASALAGKSAEAQKAAMVMANRDAGVFAQVYMQAFDQNMQAINGKLGEVWGTVGGYDEIGEAEAVPPFEDSLDQIFSAWQK